MSARRTPGGFGTNRGSKMINNFKNVYNSNIINGIGGGLSGRNNAKKDINFVSDLSMIAN
jgi:hypothetical protein